MRLVTSIDQRSGTGRRRGDGVPHLVRPLGEDIPRATGTRGTGRGLEPAVSRDVTGADEDLPRHQVGYEGACIVPEVAATTHEVVLVAAEAIALGVAVVLQQVDSPGNTYGGEPDVGLLGQVGHDQLTGAVLGEQVLKTIALGGGELRMGAHIQVETSTAAGEDVRGA